MEHGPPPLFNQGVSARARLLFFATLAIVLLLVDARVRALDSVRRGLAVVLYPVERVLLWPRDAASGIGDYLVSVGGLTRENEALRRAALDYAQRALATESLAAENEQLRRLLGLRARPGTHGEAAQVLYESRDRFARRVVIDGGALRGIAAGSPVIDELGVVGQVTRVYPLTAEVTLLTDRDQAIPVQVLRNGLRGVAFGGQEPGTLDLRFLASNADVVAGDAVVTSGIDGVYPPGLPVAHVDRVEREAKDQFARIVMRPDAGVQAHTMLMVVRVEDTDRPPAPEPPAPAPTTKPGARDARRAAAP